MPSCGACPMQDLLVGHFGLESLLRCFGVVQLLRVIQNSLLLQDPPLPGHIAPPLPLSSTLEAASGCLQWQVLPPDMRVQKKMAQAASGFLQ